MRFVEILQIFSFYCLRYFSRYIRNLIRSRISGDFVCQTRTKLCDILSIKIMPDRKDVNLIRNRSCYDPVKLIVSPSLRDKSP